MKRQSTVMPVSAPVVIALLVATLLLPATAFAADEIQAASAQQLGTCATQTDAVVQTDATKSSVTVEWGTPSQREGDPDALSSYYKVEWGEKGYAHAATVPFGTNSFKIEKLSAGITYQVKVSYCFEDGVVPWRRKCTATTFTTGVTGTAGWKYDYFINGNLSLSIPAAQIPSSVGGYSSVVLTGPKVNVKKLEKRVTGYNYYNKYDKGALHIIKESLPKKSAVATVAVHDWLRTSDGMTIYGAWMTKRVVADPYFYTGTVANGTGVYRMKVTISPLKYAKSYTIYVGKRVGDKRADGTYKVKGGWKKAATVKAKSGKKVSAVISKFNGKALQAEGHNYAVKVVTNTEYGKSPGLWQAYW